MALSSKKVQFAINLILILLTIACVFPLLLVISASITDENILLKNGYSIFPSKISFEAYQYIFKAGNTILRSYGITFFITIVGTFMNVAMTILLAYPLSRKELKGRNVVSFLIFFTMLFNGGLVPSYMMWTQVFHIRDTLAALLIPNLMLQAFYIIMMRNFISSIIPESFIEAAKIEGAGEMQLLGKIVLPLSKPILATVGLMVGLGYWNDWMNGLYYLIQRTDLYSLQNVLNTMLNNINYLKSQAAIQGSAVMIGALPSVGLRMGLAVIAILPILIVYPFIQNGFVKGIVIGGVKG